MSPDLAAYGTAEKPWLRPDGSIIACVEKLKVLRENLEELRADSLAALEDAVLMGCCEQQFKQALFDMISGLSTGYGPSDAG